MGTTQLDAPHRLGRSSRMDDRRARSRRASGSVQPPLGPAGRDANVLLVCVIQSPGGAESITAAATLQSEEATASARAQSPTTDRIATTKGGTRFLATTSPSPKPASRTGTSTSACPPREGTPIPSCWRRGEATLQRDTPTTLTLDEGPRLRGTPHRVTAP